ncbi:glycosyltransferase family 2 protein [Thermodesulfobacteriota bacterium]
MPIVRESVSFFFPAYFDEKSIPELMKDFHSALQDTGRAFEIIIIDDCSPDGTGEVADIHAKELCNTRVIHNKRNMGYGGALATGFSNAKMEVVGFTDGDAQYSVRDLPKFLEAIGEADIVVGYRENRAEGLKRKFFKQAYRLFLFLLFGLRVKDPDCSFKMMKAGLFSKMKIVSKSGFFSAELIYKARKAGLRIKEVPVTHLKRQYGKSTFFGVGNIFAMFKDMLQVRFKRN